MDIPGVPLAPLADALRAHVLTHRVIHADETPVALLAPGKSKTHRAYIWVYRTTQFTNQQAVWFDFCTGRDGEHPRRVLGGYTGTVVTDDYAGYKSLYAQGRIAEAGCMVHARRKQYKAHELTGSAIAGHAVTLMAKLYVIEREIQQLGDLDAATRLRIRQECARPVVEELHEWLTTQRAVRAGPKQQSPALAARHTQLAARRGRHAQSRT